MNEYLDPADFPELDPAARFRAFGAAVRLADFLMLAAAEEAPYTDAPLLIALSDKFACGGIFYPLRCGAASHE